MPISLSGLYGLLDIFLTIDVSCRNYNPVRPYTLCVNQIKLIDENIFLVTHVVTSFNGILIIDVTT